MCVINSFVYSDVKETLRVLPHHLVIQRAQSANSGKNSDDVH